MTVHISDSVATLAHRAPVLVAADQTLRAVAHTLWTESVGALVVGDAQRPVGVISERDVVAALAQGADPDVATAGDVMTRYVISARPHDPLFDAASQMLDDAIRHMPVVDGNGTVVGMVSVRDLILPLLLDALSVTTQIREEGP
jgi:CBS domain-containing protein